jgi:hypothetical protein
VEDTMTLQMDNDISANACVLSNEEIASENSKTDWAIGLNVHVVDFLSGYTVAGVLMSFTPGEVTVLVDEIMPEQRSVTVQFDKFVFEGETLFCRPKDHGYEAHITIDDTEKSGLRKEPRFPVRLAGQMFPPNSDPVPITIVDFSSDGLGIELPIAVQVDQPIAIAGGPAFVFATVRHCRSIAGGGFRAGVEMQHVLERPMEAETEEEPPSLLSRVFGGKNWRARRGSKPGLLVRSPLGHKNL